MRKRLVKGDQTSECLQEAEACESKCDRCDAGCCATAAALADGASDSHRTKAAGMHALSYRCAAYALCYRCAALHHVGNNACAAVHVNPLQTHLTGP
jgi:hypothetical protein